MKILDKPITREQKQSMLDMLEGNIARICVSDDPEEIVKSLGFATNRLSMIAYSRIKELKERS